MKRRLNVTHLVTNLMTTVLMQSSTDPALAAGEGPTPKTFWLPEGASTFAETNDWVFNFINYIFHLYFNISLNIF